MNWTITSESQNNESLSKLITCKMRGSAIYAVLRRPFIFKSMGETNFRPPPTPQPISMSCRQIINSRVRHPMRHCADSSHRACKFGLSVSAYSQIREIRSPGRLPSVRRETGALASTPPGMPGTYPPIFWLGGDVNGNIPANIITYFWI